MNIGPRYWEEALVAARQIATACHCDRLRRAARVVTQIYDDHLASTGIRLPELTLLSTIWSASPDGIGLLVLADRMDADPSTISRNVAVAVRHGFVQRVRYDGQPGRWVRLTPRGADLVTEAVPMWKAAEHYVVPRLRSDDALRTKVVLGTLIALRDERFDPVPESG